MRGAPEDADVLSRDAAGLTTHRSSRLQTSDTATRYSFSVTATM
jgi:hypothetical protein